jgi:hypothetical protein
MRLLELHRAAGRHHGGGEHRRHVRGTGAYRPDADDRGAGPGRATRGERAPGRAAARSADAQHVGQDTERAQGGNDRPEPAADPAQLVAELLAAVAVAHVPASGRVRAQPAIVREDQLLADF